MTSLQKKATKLEIDLMAKEQKDGLRRGKSYF
jgi:hypothetical protein